MQGLAALPKLEETAAETVRPTHENMKRERERKKLP